MLINKEHLLSQLDGRPEDGWISVQAVRAMIEAEPSIDAKHGKWVQISPAGIYECSECGKNVMTSDIEAYKYCHGCGARMDERKES